MLQLDGIIKDKKQAARSFSSPRFYWLLKGGINPQFYWGREKASAKPRGASSKQAQR